MIDGIKSEYPHVIFIAEVYKKELYQKYIREVGFDLLYDKYGLYDRLRAIVEKNVNDDGMPVELWQATDGITRNWQFLGDLQPYMLNFLENHDEQRFASDFFGKQASNGIAPLYVSLCMNTASFMIYFGEEVGERGMDEEGFSGKDGRTTIFDWWSVASIRRLRKLIDSGEYSSLDSRILIKHGLKKEEADAFINFATAVRFAAEDEAIDKGCTYDLCYCNAGSDGFDKNRHYAFLRDHEEHTLLIVANFTSKHAQMNLKIPSHAFEWLGIAENDDFNSRKTIEVNVEPYGCTVITLI